MTTPVTDSDVLEALGDNFVPRSIASITQSICGEDVLELRQQVGQTLARLAYEWDVVKVGKRRWARRTSWMDWRDWLCVLMDAVADGVSEVEGESYTEVMQDALTYWSAHIVLSAGPEPEDWEPVATQFVTLFCSEAPREPWMTPVLRRCATVVWRQETKRVLVPILEQSRESCTDNAVRDLLSRVLERIGVGTREEDGGT